MSCCVIHVLCCFPLFPQARGKDDDDDDDDDAVTYSTVKAPPPPSAAAASSADVSDLYATINKPNQ